MKKVAVLGAVVLGLLALSAGSAFAQCAPPAGPSEPVSVEADGGSENVQQLLDEAEKMADDARENESMDDLNPVVPEDAPISDFGS